MVGAFYSFLQHSPLQTIAQRVPQTNGTLVNVWIRRSCNCLVSFNPFYESGQRLPGC
ncbi:hypothetical protein EC9_28680 [Rosistilla ulvae]|uniref:Uncharacterized protein n=1 Tax=Rosistilla ulvae TaxID=1930277 RepID=A0A517M1C6_9BACT|nr:hypothetical protein EC9_28680 [Rosistilla ulvae]